MKIMQVFIGPVLEEGRLKSIKTKHYLQCRSPKFQPSVVCSLKIIALDSRKSKIIDLYSDYTENKLQALTFAAITSVWISLKRCNLA